LGLSHKIGRKTGIPADFFGVNIAPGESPEVTDYMLQRLAELDIRQVRMDFTYTSQNSAAHALLTCLLDYDFDVFLRVFPPLEDARILHEDNAARQRWADFLQTLFSQWGQKVSCFEIGNTPNRGRWSGFSSRSFLAAWQIAQQQVGDRQITLAGPNVSDFEPLYSAAFLSLIDRVANAPQIHTNNLFVERVVEPEAYDHRVMGRMATSLLKLNLIKKARVLQSLGTVTASTDFICTYTCWTSKRLSRRAAWPRQKQADYLARYYALAACSGVLKRVYWGPLICQRDGLIDDGSEDYPDIDQVSFYSRVRGEPTQFRPTPAFYALAHCNRRLAGATCVEASHDPGGLSLLSFETSENNHFVMAWCRDAMGYRLESIFSDQDLSNALFYDIQGRLIERPVSVTEQPLYIELQSFPAITTPRRPARTTAQLCSPQWQSVPLQGNGWVGACTLRREHQLEDLDRYASLFPETIQRIPEGKVLRDARNRLWTIADPRGLSTELTVKLNRTTGLRKLTYRFRPSKGRRHWNNAVQMIRRGVATPLPIAFFERPESSGTRDSWYLCEFVPDAFSAREVYAAFRNGEKQFHGLDKGGWFELLSQFVCNMHNKQVVHRDLSSGNLMLHLNQDGVPIPQVIDIGRAWIWSGPGSRVRHRHRLLDLIRICYKLGWQDRESFIRCYEQHLGGSLAWFWRIPFLYYDSKQGLKKIIKGKRRKRRSASAA